MKKKVSYTVICAYNKDHKIPVNLEIEEGKTNTESSIDIHCPFCDKYVTAKIDKKPANDTVIHRTLSPDRE